jgi:hypothetical protein
LNPANVARRMSLSTSTSFSETREFIQAYANYAYTTKDTDLAALLSRINGARFVVCCRTDEDPWFDGV